MSTDRSSALHTHPDLPWPIAIRVHPRARRLKLRLDTESRQLLLTCPPRASRKAALAWAISQRDWVAQQLSVLPDGDPIADGLEVAIDDVPLVVRFDPAEARTPAVIDGELRCGGSADGVARRVEQWLRAEARRILSDDTAHYAAKAGVTVRSVSIGDAVSRWGSCSASGAIRYNWRLILAPSAVRRWVVAHEVAHRIHMNHGPAFKALEADLYEGNVAEARLVLRRIGSRLKGIGRSG